MYVVDLRKKCKNVSHAFTSVVLVHYCNINEAIDPKNIFIITYIQIILICSKITK